MTPKRPTPETTTRSIRLPAWLWDQAAMHAREQSRSINSYVVYSIKSQITREIALGQTPTQPESERTSYETHGQEIA